MDNSQYRYNKRKKRLKIPKPSAPSPNLIGAFNPPDYRKKPSIDYMADNVIIPSIKRSEPKNNCCIIL